ncbi:MAG: glutamate--cysteine ligase [Alphaproteobacteria bacterium]|nr:glutamate--cysteine ligase [Alphaproteobacteria bacterium]
MALSNDFLGDPVTDRRQLTAYIADGCKPKAEWRIGTEHEKFVFNTATFAPTGYDGPAGIRALMLGMKAFGWQEVFEGKNLVAMKRGQTTISPEPGGQFELAGAPLANLHETAAEIDQHFTEARQAAAELGLGFLGLGFHPTAKREDIPWIPKGHYAIMRKYMPSVGTLGHDMMQQTCTTQVNLDYADEADMVLKMRVATALQPIATALFAASPFTEGQPNGYASYRMHIWQDTDAARCGMPEFVFEDGFGFERYADYALSVPMYYVRRGGGFIDASGQSFADFMAGKLPALPGETPYIGDWLNHLGVLYPDVRLKSFMEMRGADAGTVESILALPSFWTGIMYDSIALDAAWQLIKVWSAEDRAALHRDVPKRGLKTPVAGKTAAWYANEAVKLAQQGLRRRAVRLHGMADETRYLDRLFMITEGEMSYADDLLMRFEHFWKGDISKVFEDCRL